MLSTETVALFSTSQLESFMKWSITYKIKMNNKWLLCIHFRAVDLVQTLLLFIHPRLLPPLVSSTLHRVPLQLCLNPYQLLEADSTPFVPLGFLYLFTLYHSSAPVMQRLPVLSCHCPR